MKVSCKQEDVQVCVALRRNPFGNCVHRHLPQCVHAYVAEFEKCICQSYALVANLHAYALFWVPEATTPCRTRRAPRAEIALNLELSHLWPGGGLASSASLLSFLPSPSKDQAGFPELPLVAVRDTTPCTEPEPSTELPSVWLGEWLVSSELFEAFQVAEKEAQQLGHISVGVEAAALGILEHRSLAADLCGRHQPNSVKVIAKMGLRQTADHLAEFFSSSLPCIGPTGSSTRFTLSRGMQAAMAEAQLSA